MTEKLYYKDAYISAFEANILSVEKTDSGFDVVLDKTAFFPEEGGQSADTGRIGSARVVDAYERDGIIHHITDSDLGEGRAECSLDFDIRFEKMQLHTAEHILCGIIHRLFGLDNVGFHLGDDEVTFDISAPLSREDLDRVEDLANEAVFKNIKVEAFFPKTEELSDIEYRSKLDLVENVRIVKIGEVDTCACCAPHVARTGEIGLIKILDFMKHRGGLRIWMCAGGRALADYRKKYENIRRISALLSSPQHVTADALEKYISDTEQLKYELKSAKIAAAELAARALGKVEGNAVHYFAGYSMEELRAFSNVYKDSVGGLLVALSGNEGDYKYIISSNFVDLSAKVKEINSALKGRGGGKSAMVQGSFGVTLSEIEDYFK